MAEIAEFFELSWLTEGDQDFIRMQAGAFACMRAPLRMQRNIIKPSALTTKLN